VSTDGIEVGTKKALVLTEAERLQRREESARRRKRQMEQKLQDEQVCLSSSGLALFALFPLLGMGDLDLESGEVDIWYRSSGDRWSKRLY